MIAKTVTIWAGLGLVLGASFAYANESADSVALRRLYARPRKVAYPADNAYSKDREELGRMLFFDPRVSGSQIMSCATCHNPSFAWTDSLPKGVGHGHKPLGRRTPTILNLADAPRLFWDGRAVGLEEQALGPIQSEGEMNQPLDGMVKKIATIYRSHFEKAYPGEPVTEKTVAKAIATFERGVVSGTAPFDRWVAGKSDAISPAAKRGFQVFSGKANCVACHSGWNFTDHGFHDIGMPDDDLGRGKLLPKLASMQHAFKTPTLRNLLERAPFLHDGSAATLAEVIDLYDAGGRVKRESLSSEIKPLALTATEKQDLVEFLKTLASVDRPVTIPVLPR